MPVAPSSSWPFFPGGARGPASPFRVAKARSPYKWRVQKGKLASSCQGNQATKRGLPPANSHKTRKGVSHKAMHFLHVELHGHSEEFSSDSHLRSQVCQAREVNYNPPKKGLIDRGCPWSEWASSLLEEAPPNRFIRFIKSGVDVGLSLHSHHPHGAAAPRLRGHASSGTFATSGRRNPG